MSDQLTIVLPLKGRPLFTLRFLWYANQLKLPYRILIADGEVREDMARLLERPERVFPNIAIEYVRYPDDLNFQNFFKKMASAVERVRTPFAMLADNDDFLIPSGIARSIEFLQTHRHYVCAGAGVSGFSVYAPQAAGFGGLVGPFNRFRFRYAPADRSSDIGTDLAVERLRIGMRSSWTYYSVFRSETLAIIHREVLAMSLSDLQLHERFCIMRTLVSGKAYSDGAAISYLRQYGTSMQSAFLRDWVHHVVRSRFSIDVQSIVDRVAGMAAAADGADAGDAREVIRVQLAAWLRNFLRLNYGPSGAIRSRLRARAPALIAWLKHRRRFLVGAERQRFFAELRLGGAVDADIQQFKRELSAIDSVLTGPEFREFIAPYARVFAPPVAGGA